MTPILFELPSASADKALLHKIFEVVELKATILNFKHSTIHHLLTMLYLFIGNDFTAHQIQISKLLGEMNLHPPKVIEDLKSGCSRCLTNSLLSEVTVTKVSVQTQDLKFLEPKLIKRLHSSLNVLILLCQDFNGQAKVGKILEPYVYASASLPNTWDKRGIKQNIDLYAKRLGLYLSPGVKEYLVEAVNNDLPVIYNGLSTISLLSSKPEMELVRQIIPSIYASSIELKDMILERRRDWIPEYLDRLVLITTKQQAIIGALKYQFSTLLQVAVGIDAALDNQGIAQIADINNPKRIYYLRQELQQVSVPQLVWLNQQLLEADKSYYSLPCLKAKLVYMCCY
ncbi:MAG: hypothetical protein AAFQ80_07845 [Cyanobacteria bacterium J06621_8]